MFDLWTVCYCSLKLSFYSDLESAVNLCSKMSREVTLSSILCQNKKASSKISCAGKMCLWQRGKHKKVFFARSLCFAMSIYATEYISDMLFVFWIWVFMYKCYVYMFLTDCPNMEIQQARLLAYILSMLYLEFDHTSAIFLIVSLC